MEAGWPMSPRSGFLPPQHQDYKPKLSQLIDFAWVLGDKLRSLNCKAYRQNCLRGPPPSVVSAQPRVGARSKLCVSPRHTHALGPAQGAALWPTLLIWPMVPPAPTSS